jgi:hypothetical protein
LILDAIIDYIDYAISWPAGRHVGLAFATLILKADIIAINIG